MKEKIKSGMLVITKNKECWLVVDTNNKDYGLILKSDSGYMPLSVYSDDLKVGNDDYNIMIFGTTTKYGTVLNDMAFDKIIYENENFKRMLELEAQLITVKKQLELE